MLATFIQNGFLRKVENEDMLEICHINRQEWRPREEEMRKRMGVRESEHDLGKNNQLGNKRPSLYAKR
jgi:hypothetical protein